MPLIAGLSEIGGPDQLQLFDWPLPTHAPHEVQVHMRFAGLNRAELMFLNGTYIV